MENLADHVDFEELDQILGQHANEWKMTLDLFVKFQMRRGASQTAGKEPLKKNLLKLMALQSIAATPDAIDPLFTGSESYVQQHLSSQEEYVVKEEDIREKVVSNATSIFLDIKEAYVENNM